MEPDAEQVAKQYGIHVPTSGLAKNLNGAEIVAEKIGFPLVMKIVSEDILHKTEAGGVKTSIESLRQLRDSYDEIVRNVRRVNRKVKINGVLVQKMAPRGLEFVVGAKRDPQFGPTIMFGLGGTYVEVFKDVTFCLAPLSEREALGMMKGIKSSVFLNGFRGSKPLDQKAAAKTIVAVGELMCNEPAIESIDINPLFVYPKGVLAVDVRIMLSQSTEDALVTPKAINS